MIKLRRFAAASIVLAGLAAGCGSSSSSSSTSSANSTQAASSGGSGQSSGAGTLSADARSAATGDIPDNQVFLVYNDRSAGFSMKYPEGWTQSGSGNNVTFRIKNNLVHVAISSGPAPTPATVKTQLQKVKQTDPTLVFTTPAVVQVSGHQAVKVLYSTESAPNPVTGKRVKLIVDRYALANGSRVAIVDLGTAKGVDNIDAYRMMIQSFRWK
jgi:hypothetical protein